MFLSTVSFQEYFRIYIMWAKTLLFHKIAFVNCFTKTYLTTNYSILLHCLDQPLSNIAFFDYQTYGKNSSDISTIGAPISKQHVRYACYLGWFSRICSFHDNNLNSYFLGILILGQKHICVCSFLFNHKSTVLNSLLILSFSHLYSYIKNAKYVIVLYVKQVGGG